MGWVQQAAVDDDARGLCVLFGTAGLRFVQAPVGPLLFHEFVVWPDFHHFAAVHHHQAIGLAQGREAVGNGNGGAALHQVVERPLDFLLSLGVHG